MLLLVNNTGKQDEPSLSRFFRQSQMHHIMLWPNLLAATSSRASSRKTLMVFTRMRAILLSRLLSYMGARALLPARSVGNALQSPIFRRVSMLGRLIHSVQPVE